MNRRSAALLIALLATASLVVLTGPALALESPWDSQRLFPVQDVLLSSVDFDLNLDLDVSLRLDPSLGPDLAPSSIPSLTQTKRLEDEFSFEGLDEKLHRIPLRPVVLGEVPRIPWDPERAVGLVFRVPFSL